MDEKKYPWGGTLLTIEELRKVDPMAASNIDAYTPPPKESKADRNTSDWLLIWLGIWVGGVIVYLLVKN